MAERTHMRNYASNAVAQMVGRGFSLAATLTSFVLIARVLGPEEFGRYSYIMTFVAVGVTLAEFGTTAVLAKHLAEADPREAPSYWANFLWFRLLLVTVVLALALPTAFLVRPDLMPALWIGLLGLPVLATRFFEPVFQVYETPHYSTICSVSYAFVLLAVTLVCLEWWPDLFSLIVVYLLANLFYTVVAFVMSGRRIRPRFGVVRSTLRKIARLAGPVGVSAVFTIAHTRAAIFMLSALESDHEVGLYNAAFRFVEMVALVAAVLMNPLIPIFSQQARSDRDQLRRTYVQIVEGLVLVGLPVAVTAPFVSNEVIDLLYGTAFAESARVLDVFAWTFVLIPWALFSVALCVAIGVVRFGYWNTALAATLNVSLNWLWIPSFGVVGSAWASLVGEVQMLSVGVFFIIRNLGNVFRLSFWVRVLGLNGALYALLSLTVPIWGVVGVIPAALFYLVAIHPLGLRPEIFTNVQGQP